MNYVENMGIFYLLCLFYIHTQHRFACNQDFPQIITQFVCDLPSFFLFEMHLIILVRQADISNFLVFSKIYNYSLKGYIMTPHSISKDMKYSQEIVLKHLDSFQK